MAKHEDNMANGHWRRDGGAVAVDSGETYSDAVGDSSEKHSDTVGNSTETGTVISAVEENSADASSLQIDQVFSILKNERRRAVLRYLQTVEAEVSLGELAEQIAAWECGKEKREITSQERKRVYVGLYQCHLPKMDDVGAITYNKPRGKIQPGEHIDAFHRYLPTETNDAENVWARVQGLLPFVFGLFGSG